MRRRVYVHTNDLHQCLLDTVKLGSEPRNVEGTDIDMVPGISTDGMTVLIRITKVLDMIFVVDAARLPTIYIKATIYEKGSLDFLAVIGVDNGPVRRVRTIIIRDSYTIRASIHRTGKRTGGCRLCG